MIAIRDGLKITRISQGLYKASISEDICYKSVAHGGFLISLIQLALEDAFEHDFKRSRQPHLLDLHSSMLRFSTAGEVEIHIKEAKLGPITSTVLFNLVQKSRINITGFATHTNFTVLHPTLFDFPYTNPTTLHPPPTQHPDFALLETNTDPNWTRVSVDSKDDLPLRAVPQYQYYYPTPGISHTTIEISSTLGPEATKIWICPLDPTQRFYTSDLGFVADMTPRLPNSIRPATKHNNYATSAIIERAIKQRYGRSDDIPPLKHDAIAFPTLSLALEIKRPLPPQGVRYLYLRATMQWYQGGKWDLEVVICDADMNVVALARLISLALDMTVGGDVARRGADKEERRKVTGRSGKL